MHVQDCTLLSRITSVDGGHKMNRVGMSTPQRKIRMIRQSMIGQVRYLAPLMILLR